MVCKILVIHPPTHSPQKQNNKKQLTFFIIKSLKKNVLLLSLSESPFKANPFCLFITHCIIKVIWYHLQYKKILIYVIMHNPTPTIPTPTSVKNKTFFSFCLFKLPDSWKAFFVWLAALGTLLLLFYALQGLYLPCIHTYSHLLESPINMHVFGLWAKATAPGGERQGEKDQLLSCCLVGSCKG